MATAKRSDGFDFKKSQLDKVEEPEVDVIEDEEEVDEEKEVEDKDDPKNKEKEDKEEDDEEEVAKIDFQSLYEDEKEENKKLLNKALGEDKEEPKAPEPIVLEFMNNKNFSDDQFDKAVSTKESFINTLNEFGNKVRTQTTDAIMNDIPRIVTNIVTFQVRLNELNRDLYKDNPELVPVKKFVGSLADELIKKKGINDLDDYESMLKELPKIVRKQLNIKKTDKVEKKKVPLNPKTTSQRRGDPEEIEGDLTPLQKDIKRSLAFLKKG